uniref:Uncharacterized protein n=1 Tax=Anguilla anguilla TaxID=7936 RepID=A0A0E9QJT5_ANGAN
MVVLFFCFFLGWKHTLIFWCYVYVK